MTSAKEAPKRYTLYGKTRFGRNYRLGTTDRTFGEAVGRQIALNNGAKDDLWSYFMVRDFSDLISDSEVLYTILPGDAYPGVRTLVKDLESMGMVTYGGGGYFWLAYSDERVRGMENVASRYAEERNGVLVVNTFVYPRESILPYEML